MVARTIAGFMNRHGGTLIIGVNDSGEPLGLDADIAMLARKDLDGFEQTLVQVVSNHLGKETAALLRFQIAKIGPDSRPVAVVDCPASAVPVFLLDANAKEFHVRTANTTRLLDIEEAASYIGQHWKQQAAAPATV
jgi:predicted HTH transcriptional regulator